ncbi:hypothetical protein CASFOL_020899 [Castilleja foliolosa]|uniref:Uncharacterized protein n=1 Tax=Castilleja foliolosa TaxID=1961234 RepID=A0ABD3D3Q0_9LAMI
MEDVDDDAEDEPVVDIDNGDRKNPVAVTEYMIDDLYAHYKRAENRGEMVRVSVESEWAAPSTAGGGGMW